jgi:hypothetical protein
VTVVIGPPASCIMPGDFGQIGKSEGKLARGWTIRR